MSKPKTIFCDLDGTLVKHSNPIDIQNPNLDLEVLPGVHEKLKEWDLKGYTIIITTGRKESARKSTEEQLRFAGIVYDQLIMGFGGGDRILINDKKPHEPNRDTAYTINLERNTGLVDIEV
jgi:hydroxymethylpyrimidine pyrophosphatase-like HAD family hydrolase